MEVKCILTCFGLIYLGVLLPKSLSEGKYDSSAETLNTLKLLPSSAKPMEQDDDDDLNLQSKTNTMQNTENSQFTQINTEFQSNMIGSTTLNKETLLGETMKEETMKEETINSETSFTKAASSIEGSYISNNDIFITEGNQESDQSLLRTENQNLITDRFSSVQPSTKVVDRKPFALHVTNATETSISVSWNATENVKRFIVSIAKLPYNDEKYNDIEVNNTSVTITNLTCSGCHYNISVKSVYDINKFSESISTTNFTVPRMPKVEVEENPSAVIIKISMKNQECDSLRNDQNWEIIKGNLVENCIIEVEELDKHVNYNLTIWRVVDVWKSEKELITYHLQPEPNAVINILHKFTENDIYISWEKPNDSKVDSYRIIVTIENPYLHNCTNTTTPMTNYTISNFLPGSQYTIDVYAINSVGTSPGNNISFTTPSDVPDAVNISIKDRTAVNVTISLSHPQSFKGDILGYFINIYKDKRRLPGKKLLKKYHISCFNCSQAYVSTTNGCPCSKQCYNMEMKIIYSLTEPFTLNSLTPGTSYYITAEAYTSAGCGKQNTNNFTTEESAPSKIQNLDINTTQTEAMIEWEEPKHPNGKIQYYSIRLYHYNSLRLSGNSTEKNFVLENLVPYQTYTLKIAAVNSMFGEICTAIFKTKIAEPEPVNISIVNTTSKSITIKWISLHPYGAIKNYYVSWKTVEENTSASIDTALNTIYTISDLEPYRVYMIKVKICNIKYCTNSKAVPVKTMIGVPYPVRNIVAKAESATSIRVSWKEPMQFTGPTTYIIQAQSSSTQKISQPLLGPFTVSGFHNTSFLVKGLQEYWPYKFTITTNTTAGIGHPVTTLPTWTEESTPGPVESLDIYVNYSCYIALLVTWKKPLPEDENGIILKYEITYWADNNDKKKICVNATLFSTMMIVFGEHSYTIQIRAETSKGLGDTRNKTVYVKPQIPVVPNDVFVTRSSAEVEDSSRQIAINLPNKFFLDFTFGKPVQWGLIIAQSEAINRSGQEHTQIYPRELKQWNEVYDEEIAHPYRPTPTDWKPPYFLTKNINAVYILGADEDCEDNKIYCNGYLKPNRYYRVKAFMCTKGGCSATKYSAPMHTDKDRTAIYVTVPVLVVAAAVALNIVFIMWHKKLYCFKKKQISTISSLVDANQNGKVNHSFAMKTSEYSRPILLAHFHSKVEMMKRDSNIQFCEEFKLLKSLSPVQPHVAAELQVNRTKNRYTNILAYDHSRVKLLPMDDDEGSDYINANYIPGYSLLREYIASQGPLHSTKDDFWRMIWEQNVSIIVMVTLPVERGRVKCEEYWPKGSEPVYFGDLVVQLKSESNLSDYVIRILDVNIGETTKEVKQFHFLKWPDFGCPQKTSLLINFVQTVRTHMPYTDAGPTLVHCSAGVGRTGTFIVIDRLLQHMQSNYEVDIFGLILELRKYRPNMVQTEDQYIFIYQCIADHLKEIEKIDTENIYINETGM